MLGAIPLTVLGASSPSLLPNAGFADGLTGWQVNPGAARIEAVRIADRSAACIVVPDGAVVGNTLFWVNSGTEPATVQLSGFRAAQVRILTEAALTGDRECGARERIKGDRFTAPPQSFGYAR